MENKKEVKIIADKYKVYGPKEDGSWRIDFYVGEYMKDNVSELIRMMESLQAITLLVSQQENG